MRLPALLPALLAVLLAVPLPATALPEAVRNALRDAGLGPDDLAVRVMPLQGRWPALRHRSEVPMQPASTMKVVTSAVALDRLGPNHRGFTALLSAAPVEGDALRGPLVLQGGSDPEFGLPGLYELLVTLRDQGVRVIDGDLWLDRSRWNPGRPDRGVPPFDDAPEFPYNVIPDPLHLAGALHGLELRGEADGVRARLVPALPGVVLDNRLVPDDSRCGAWTGWEAPTHQVSGEGAASVVTVVLQGRFPRQCLRLQRLDLMDRDLLAERLVRRVWSDLGGSWRGQVREAAAPAGARVLARRDGRPWGELLRPLNKLSDNAWTRILFMELGVAAAARAGAASAPERLTADWADADVRHWFAERGIDTTGLVLDNGSGLSRSERLTATQLARLLQASLTGPNAPDLRMSLPTAGVDGTLRNRLRGTAAAGTARLKTGTLRNVSALAGVVTDRDGNDWVTVVLVNQDEAPQRARGAMDALVAWVAEGGMTAPHTAPAGPGGDGP